MELQLKDLDSVLAKKEKTGKAARTGDKEAVKQLEFYVRLISLLESGENARKLELEESEEFMMQEMQSFRSWNGDSTLESSSQAST